MRRAAAGAQRRRSGEVLPRPERTKGAGGDRSHGTRTLVRGVTDGVEVRAMGRRPGADSGQTSAEAQERPRGCATPAQATGGRSLSPGVGAECRESGCAPTALAPASAVADAHTGHESVAGHRPERRGAAQEGVVEPAGGGAIRDANASSLGYTTPERSVRLARPPQPEDRGVKRGDRARSRATAGSETADDPPGCRGPYRPGLCLDHWVSGAVPARQADRQLSGAGSLRGLQCRSPAAGTYQQARERSATFLAGGGRAGRRPLRPRVATSLPAPGDASAPRDRQGGDGTQAGRRPLLDVAQGMGLPADGTVWFARGRARNRPWCAVDHRQIDWASRSLISREFEFVIMIEVVTE